MLVGAPKENSQPRRSWKGAGWKKPENGPREHFSSVNKAQQLQGNSVWPQSFRKTGEVQVCTVREQEGWGKGRKQQWSKNLAFLVKTFTSGKETCSIREQMREQR